MNCVRCGQHQGRHAPEGHDFIPPTDANRLRVWAQTQYIGDSRDLMLRGAAALEAQDANTLKDLPLPVSRYFNVNGKEAKVAIWYPRSAPEGASCFTSVEVELVDVRATDSVRVSYDFDRDGWLIEQDTHDSGEWVEVAFVQAWASEKVADQDQQGPVE